MRPDVLSKIIGARTILVSVTGRQTAVARIAAYRDLTIRFELEPESPLPGPGVAIIEGFRSGIAFSAVGQLTMECGREGFLSLTSELKVRNTMFEGEFLSSPIAATVQSRPKDLEATVVAATKDQLVLDTKLKLPANQLQTLVVQVQDQPTTLAFNAVNSYEHGKKHRQECRLTEQSRVNRARWQQILKNEP